MGIYLIRIARNIVVASAIVFGLAGCPCCYVDGGGGIGGPDFPYGNYFNIGGAVSGLAAGNSIVLQNNGADTLTVSSNGPFMFFAPAKNGAAYNVTISIPPIGQPCTGTYGAAIADYSNVTNINVICGPAFVGAFSATANLATARQHHTATSLPNGKVLVSGGYTLAGGFTTYLASAELYDPANNSWSAAGNMATARAFHTATLLSTGKVLVAGGSNLSGGTVTALADAELYDPATNTWQPASNTSTGAARNNPAAVLLLTPPFRSSSYSQIYDLVLLAGGTDSANASLASATIYQNDSTLPFWWDTGVMVTARSGHTATLLPNGKVLVAGGHNTSGGITNYLASAELYDPIANSWSAAGNLVVARDGHTATILPNGKVLVAGGHNVSAGVTNYLASAELYDPATQSWSLAGNLVVARSSHTATLLPTGKVLVAGGMNTTGGVVTYLASAELFDPAANSWSATGTMLNARTSYTATLLHSGKLLIVGGAAGAGSLASAELYW